MLNFKLDTTDGSVGPNLRRLFVLRNFIILGVIFAVVGTLRWLSIPLPLVPLATVIACVAALNIFTWLRIRSDVTISEQEFFIQLVLDVAGIAVLLYYTGGATNPFAWFFLLPLVISAAVLPSLYTWIMMVLVSLCYSALIAWHIPLPGMEMGMVHHGGFTMHVIGMWFGFVFSAWLIAYFVGDMANAMRDRDRKLAKVREHRLRDEQVVALGTLAAGAAHELGTPLGTMAILAKELIREYPPDQFNELHDKLIILREQVDRCKGALSIISASTGEVRAESGHLMLVDQYLEDVIRQWRGQRPEINLLYEAGDHAPSSSILAETTLTQALINIMNNAADASPEHVKVDARWDTEKLVLKVYDQGGGLDSGARHSMGKKPYSSKEYGLGVGLFLAHTTINRLGGDITILDREFGGVCTQVILPLLSQVKV